jgi:hypothetical protein
MSLKAIVTEDEFAALDVTLQKEYVTRDGQYVLDVISEGGLELVDASGLKSALQKERSAKNAAEKAAGKWAGVDFTPEQAQEAVSKVAEMADWDPEKKLVEARTQMEKQLADAYAGKEKTLTDKYDKDVGSLRQTNESLTSQLRQTLVDTELTAAIAAEKGVVELLLHPLRDHIQVKEVDGKFVARVVDNEGNDRLSTRSGSGPHDLMGIPELVTEMKSKPGFSRAFEGSSGGSGALPGSGNAGQGGPYTISAADAQDMGKYRTARERAEKAGATLQILD